MRDLLFTAVLVFLMPICFRRPFIGLAVFSWLAYMRPQDLCWGFARPQRWSFLIAALTLAGFLYRPRKQYFVQETRTILLLVMGFLVVLGVALSGHIHSFQVNRLIEYLKIIGVALFTTAVVTTPERMRVLIWILALSFGFYGVKTGLAGVLSGGNMEVLRGPGGMLEDNNDFSLALCMALPMLIHLGSSEKNPVLRRGVWLCVPLTILTVILTHSRGGFLALAATLGVLWWRSRSRVLVALVAVLVGGVGLLFVPDAYWDRIQSISNYEQDGSAMGRIAAWKTAIRMALDNPVMGVGFMNFRFFYTQYAGGPNEFIRVAHNSYLQIWAECGTPTLVIYLILIAWCLWSVWRIRRRAMRYFNSSWIINYAAMFEASIVAFIIGSVFLNRAAFDLWYHFIGITLAFQLIAEREMQRLHVRPEYADLEYGGRGVASVRERGFRRPGRQGGFVKRPAFEPRS